MGELTERQKFLLTIVVHEYIKTAAPVGSQHLVDHYRLDMSSATVRNELAALGGPIEFVEAWDAASLRHALEQHRDLDLALVDRPAKDAQRCDIGVGNRHAWLPEKGRPPRIEAHQGE